MDTPSQDEFSFDGDHAFEMPFRPPNPPDKPMSERARAVGMRLYFHAWDAYREAGMPFGSSDDAMIIWYTFRPNEDFDLGSVYSN
jgi:hypothetical protein